MLMFRRSGKPGEATSWGGTVKTFSLVNSKTFETMHDLPRIPGEFPDGHNINGLGHVLSIVDFPDTYYYIPEDAYKWLGSPPKTSGGKQKWPKLDGFVFLGGQAIQSEGSVHLHVDKAHTQSPTLAIHEQDTDNLNWIRWGPWKGRGRMMETWEENFCVSKTINPQK